MRFALVLSMTIYALLLKYLSLRGQTLSENLISLGFGSLVCVLLFSYSTNAALIPRNLKLQFVRLILACVSLALIIFSYRFVSATAVALVTSADIPLLALFSKELGGAFSKRRLTALVSLFGVLAASFYLGNQGSLELLGIGICFLGTCLVTVGYLLLKKSAEQESESVAILTPSLSLLLSGFVLVTQSKSVPALSSFNFLLGLVSGVGMFLIYRITIALYKKYDLAKAEFPTLFSALVVYFGEALFFRQPFEVPQILVLLFLIFVLWTVLNRKEPITEEISYGT